MLCLATVVLAVCLASAKNLHSVEKREVPDHSHFPFMFPNMNFHENFFNPMNPIDHDHPINHDLTINHDHPINQVNPLNNIHSGNDFYNNYYSHMNTHFLPSDHKCVKPYDLDATLMLLSNNTEGYPVDAIALEISQRPDLVQHLPAGDPVVSGDEYTVDPNYSCPTMKKRLRSFTKYGGQCWILDNLMVNYGYCMNAYCSNHHYGNSLYTRSMCMEHFDTVYVWAYCENYTVNPALKIRQEALQLPKYCSCKSVRCY